jgi:hypothetical protein
MAAISAQTGNKTCSVFSTVTGAPQGSLVRFVVGENAKPVLMQSAAMNAELDDPFANLLLKQGVFPATGQDLLAALDAKVGAGDPLAAQSQMSFVLGEGSQIPLPDATPSTNAAMRFVVSRVREMPISESRLLFPETNIPAAQRRVMKSDGAVVLV